MFPPSKQDLMLHLFQIFPSLKSAYLFHWIYVIYLKRKKKLGMTDWEKKKSQSQSFFILKNDIYYDEIKFYKDGV